MDKVKTHINHLYYAQGDIFDYTGGGFDAIIVFIEGGFSGINTEYWTREKELAEAPVMVIPFNGSSSQKVHIKLNDIHHLVFMTLDAAVQHNCKNIGFHGIRAEDADDHTGAEYTIKAVTEWLTLHPNAVRSITLVDKRNCYKKSIEISFRMKKDKQTIDAIASFYGANKVVNPKNYENPIEKAAELAINVAVEENPTYSTDADRKGIRIFWKELLMDYLEKYKKIQTCYTFVNDVMEIQNKMNDKFPDSFKNKGKRKGKGKGRDMSYVQRFRVAHAQKSLSVFLKHMWCINDDMPEPPMCPIDYRILKEVKVFESWTKLDDREKYCEWLKKINDIAKTEGMTPAKWELVHWNKQSTQTPPKVKARNTKSDRLKNVTNNEWNAYQPFVKLEGNTNGMELVKPGYCLPLKNNDGVIERYRIFVAKHTSGTTGGHYFCKIEKEWGREIGNIEDNPDVCKIINDFTPTLSIYNQIITEKDGKWHRKTGAKYAYRFVTFEKTIKEDAALTFLEQIKDYVQNTLKN